MEITVTGRQLKVSDRFRNVLTDKLGKVELLAPRTQRVEVVVSKETSRQAPKGSERIEITCIAKGPIIRAEAFADDKYAALDMAIEKLAERLRRVGDRRKVQRRRAAPALSLAEEPLHTAGEEGQGEEPRSEVDVKLGVVGDSLIDVREKIHTSSPMTLAQALDHMEMVGHDFYLFHDSDTDMPSVVYRRRGWDYGVIHLRVEELAQVNHHVS